MHFIMASYLQERQEAIDGPFPFSLEITARMSNRKALIEENHVFRRMIILSRESILAIEAWAKNWTMIIITFGGIKLRELGRASANEIQGHSEFASPSVQRRDSAASLQSPNMESALEQTCITATTFFA